MTLWCAKGHRWLLAWVIVACLPLRLAGHVPVPESVLNPQSAPEAWNVLRLASANLDRLIAEGRLEEVPDQASLCPPSLRLLARLAEPATKRQEVAVGTVRAGSAINSLAQACVAGDRAGAGVALAKWHAALDTLAAGEDTRTVQADVFFCPMHPDVLSLAAGSSCPKCGMALKPRRVPYSFVYAAPPGEPSLAMTLNADGPPTAGQRLRVRMHLAWRDGTPVSESDLLVAHTQQIHLLIIDPALEDYHHVHPTATGAPGEYELAFEPRKTSAYRVYADVVPAATNIQEYIAAELPAAMTGRNLPAIRRENCTEVEVGGLRFQMTTGEAAGTIIHAKQAQALQSTGTEADGQPTHRLEPVMNAFAHLVGFYDDGRTVVHLHPTGPDVEDAAARGGPALEFRIYPPQPGFLRLYCQVSVGGADVYAPFGVNVLP